MAAPVQPHVTGDGPPLVLQGPAWGPSSDYLRLTLAPMIHAHRVITYDPRNVGEGPRVDHPAAQATGHLVDDLEGLRERQGVDRFVLAGHSHGGFIAMAYAVRHPDRLQGLLLLNTRLGEATDDGERRRLLDRFVADPARRDAVALFRSTGGRPRDASSDAELARLLRRLMPAYFYDLEALRRFALAARGAPSPSASALRRIPARLEDWVELGLPHVTIPALVVTGRFDVATTPADARHIHRLLQGSQLHVFERSGHHPWVEEPQRFAAVVNEFLARVREGRADAAL